MTENSQSEEIAFSVDYDDLPDQLAIFPLTGAVLYPNWGMPLRVFEPRYVALVDHVNNIDGFIGMIQPLLNDKGEPTTDLSRVGCAAKIISIAENESGHYFIELAGVCRFAIESELSTDTPYRLVAPNWDEFKIDFTDDGTNEVPEQKELFSILKARVSKFIKPENWDIINQLPKEGVVNFFCTFWPFIPAEKQALLEAYDLNSRYSTMMNLIEMDMRGNTPETLQ